MYDSSLYQQSTIVLKDTCNAGHCDGIDVVYMIDDMSTRLIIGTKIKIKTITRIQLTDNFFRML